MPLFRLEEGPFPEYNMVMDYDKYLKLQTRLEWFYDFHPQFFDDILPEQKKLLQDVFLYDAPDEGYPELLKDFYNKAISGKPALQHDALLAVDALYRIAGAGSLFEDDEYRLPTSKIM